MAIAHSSIDSLLLKAEQAFIKTFFCEADIVACAPGRVNLIGEHTDYNDGFVLPMALSLVTLVVGKKVEGKTCNVLSLNFDDGIVTFQTTPPKTPCFHWSNYVKGVVANFITETVGFNAVVVSSVPLGGGLSSSAALEVSFYTFLENLNNTKTKSLKEKALACQRAEVEYAFTPCGIMDQYISTMGQRNYAMLIDCRSMTSSLIPLNDQNIIFVVINSNVKHSLASSEYSIRRDDCFEAAFIMGKKILRDATIKDLEDSKALLSGHLWRRAKHVISEIKRTVEAAEAIKENNYEKFGQLMTESHMSLKNDYEVSCCELDQLVDLALSVPGVYGSRMTGGGFGGCTITLVKKESVDNLIAKVINGYDAPSIYICEASDGARNIKPNFSS